MNLLDIFRLRKSPQLEVEERQLPTQTAGERAFATYTKALDAREYSIPLEDDQFFQIDTVALFPVRLESLHTFSTDGLPQWANFDAATGLISGTLAKDASVFGNSKVVITAIDEQHDEVVIKLILCPQCVAAIADTTIHDCEIEERSSFDMSLESLFYDPFIETAPTLICVSGLPGGLHFEPELGSISGVVMNKTANRSPYVVTAWARSVQNRLTHQHFLLKVTSFDSQVPETGVGLEGVSERNGQRIEISADKLSKLRTAFISKKPDGRIESQTTGSVWESGDIKGSWGIKMPNDPEMERAGFLNPDGAEIDWTETVAALKQKQQREVLSNDDRLDRISLDAMRRDNKLYLEFQNSLDVSRDGQVQKTSIQGKGGTALPEWMNMVREGFVAATPPADLNCIELELNVDFDNGHRLIKPVRVDI